MCLHFPYLTGSTADTPVNTWVWESPYFLSLRCQDARYDFLKRNQWNRGACLSHFFKFQKLSFCYCWMRKVKHWRESNHGKLANRLPVSRPDRFPLRILLFRASLTPFFFRTRWEPVCLRNLGQCLSVIIFFGYGSGTGVACSRLSVSVDDRKSERATSGISCERDPGVKRGNKLQT